MVTAGAGRVARLDVSSDSGPAIHPRIRRAEPARAHVAMPAKWFVCTMKWPAGVRELDTEGAVRQERAVAAPTGSWDIAWTG